jgi:hypothetical protein
MIVDLGIRNADSRGDQAVTAAIGWEHISEISVRTGRSGVPDLKLAGPLPGGAGTRVRVHAQGGEERFDGRQVN